MVVKYSKPFLNKLEEIIAESEYMLRYEKGSFKAGYCVLKDTKIIIVNKYFTIDGKINCLVDILKEIDIDPAILGEKSKKLFLELSQTELKP